MSEPVGAHLVGSVPLGSNEEVFRTVVARLGDRLSRIPDGETGERSDWIVWQFPVLASAPQLEVVPPDPEHYRPLPRVQLRPGTAAGDVEFRELGYAAAARSSHEVFRRLRSEGVIPDGTRFQVCLPTPLAPIGAFVMAQDQAALEPRYQAAMERELEAILGGVPHEDLALQWDTAVEFGIYEGVFPAWFDDVRSGIIERLLRLAALVPGDVELGFHLCYGDANHRHFVEPRDAAKLVDIANAVCTGTPRPLQWIHMPVPRSRDDDAYFEPMRDLRLQPPTRLFLGLVHHTDGVEGTRRRIDAARRAVGGFGVATECGMGRRPPETIPALLDEHAAVTSPLGARAGAGRR